VGLDHQFEQLQVGLQQLESVVFELLEFEFFELFQAEVEEFGVSVGVCDFHHHEDVVLLNELDYVLPDEGEEAFDFEEVDDGVVGAEL
jgi:hypothetical protein